MNSEHEEFENFLLEYCETTVVPAEAVSVPLTLQNYERTIQANKGGSIYDDECSIPWSRDQNNINATNVSAEDFKASQDEMLFDEPVIRTTYGRGRGSRNICDRPGDGLKSLSDDDLQIQKYIRMVAPMGYRNEVTENAVSTIQKSKREQRKLEQNSRELMLKGSNKPSSSASNKSEIAGHFPKFAMTSSSKCTDTNKTKRSGYWNTLEGTNSSLICSDQKETQSKESKITSTQPNASDFVKPSVPVSSIESSKSVPGISELLRVTMEQRRKGLQIAKAEREAQKKEMEQASHKAIEELLKEDLKKEALKENTTHRSRSITSSSSSNHSQSEREVLNRRQGGDAPRFAWHRNPTKRQQKKFLNNFDDFPPLN
ncbi:uncharacterized protein [Euwallacea fornicatus]|uniref:uncharacterized protein n=1 Tax=Euwallacea fornicatus TaxID=995702 RepID=UPI00338DE5B5